jgi:tetratricopeptide (TPR) repeat protein
LGYWTYFYPPKDHDEMLGRGKEQLALAEGLVRDCPSIPLYRHDLSGALVDVAAAHINRPDKNLDAAMACFAKAKDIQEALCGEYPTSKSYSHRLESILVQRMRMQAFHFTNDEWIQRAGELRQYFIMRGERFDDDYYRLCKIAEIGWWTARELVKRGRSEESAKPAADANRTLREYIANADGELENFGTTQLEPARRYFVELHRAGLAHELTRATRDLSEVIALLKAPVQRGQYCAGVLGDYPQAAVHFQEDLRQNPDSHQAAQLAAFVTLLNGDRAAHEAICRVMLERFANSNEDPNGPWRTLISCLIASPPVGNRDELARLVDKIFELDWGTARQLASHARGLFAYRFGDWEGAVKWSAESRKLILAYDIEAQYGHANDLVIHAMALHHLGKPSEAKTAYDDAVQRVTKALEDEPVAIGAVGVGKSWFPWINFELLRREAAQLLQIPTAIEAPTKPDLIQTTELNQ